MLRNLSLMLALVLAIQVWPCMAQVPEESAASIPIAQTAAAEQLESQTGTTLQEGAMEQQDVLSFQDPNYISDEEFFGQWDAQTGDWIQLPYINYDYSTLLNPVMEAAKAGNYEAAKASYLQYYRDKEKTTVRNSMAKDTKNQRLHAEITMHNVFISTRTGGISPAAIVSVDGTWKEIRADVLEEVQANVSGATQSLPFILFALDNDGAKAEFQSKESGQVPYLEVYVNGTRKVFPVVEDTTVSPLENSGRVYGAEPLLEVQESNTYPASNAPFDSNTKRSFLKFDLSELKPGDDISSAALVLQGRNASDSQEKKVIVFKTSISNWSEETTTWANLGKQWIYSFSGSNAPYWMGVTEAESSYIEETCGMYRFMNALVGQYELTGDEQYAQHAIRLYQDFILTMSQYPTAGSALQATMRLKLYADALGKLLNSQYMTPEFHTAFIKFIWMQAMYKETDCVGVDGGTEGGLNNANKQKHGLYWHWDKQSETTNWGTMEAAALYSLYFGFKELRDAELWLEKSNERLNKGIAEKLLADYGSTEYPLGYTNVVLGDVLQPYKLASLTGEDPHYSEEIKENLVKMALGQMYRSAPGYVDMQVGNANSYTDKGTINNIKEVNKAVPGNQQLEFAATGGASGTAPDFTSILFGVQNRAVMRTDWTKNANYLHIDVNPTLYTHAHANDLAVVVLAYGENLLVDPKSNGYGNNDPIRRWANSTIGHNSVTVNGYSQKNNSQFSLDLPRGATEGDVNRWESNAAYDFFKGTTYNNIGTSGPAYADVTHSRSVLFVKPGFYIVSDFLSPEDKSRENKYEQAWHTLPGANLTIDEQTMAVKTNMEKANIQIVPVNPQEFTPKGQSEPRIVDGVRLSTDGSGIHHDGYYIGESNVDYVTYVKDGAVGDTVFNTVLFPTPVGSDYEVSTAAIPLDIKDEDGVAFDIKIQDKITQNTTIGTYYILHDENEKTKREIKDYQTDASMAYIEKEENGKIRSAILQDATGLWNEEDPLIYATSPATELSVKWGNGKVEIDSVPTNSLTGTANDLDDGIVTVDLETLTIQVDNKINTVLLNGERVPFQQKGKYIYFSDEPIIDDDTPLPDEGNNGSGNIHGGGSSSGGGGGNNTVIDSTPSPTPVPTPTPTPTPTPDPYETELQGHWAKEEVTQLLEDGIVKGDGNSLNLSENISRAEFISLIVRVLQLEPIPYTGTFHDVQGNEWYASDIATGEKYDLIDGADGNLFPNDKITREEMAKIIWKAAEIQGIQPGDKSSSINDMPDVSPWAVDYVANVLKSGLMQGMGEGTFGPKETALREQAFVVIYRLIYQKL